jgi:hypothetical protein
MAKLKGWMDVRMSLQHNTRERMPPNADPKWSGENFNYGGDTEDTLNRIGKLLPAKVRENAVYAVEVVMTASPDFSGGWKNYLSDCDQWAKGLFGEDNLLHINHHFDESTPHTHIVFMPLKDGKLNATHFIGGHRDRMAQLQTDFFEKVGRKYSLERGQSKTETRARHAAHTLAGKAAELDERKNDLDGKSSKLDEREKKINAFAAEFQNLMGMKPSDIQNLKNKLQKWETMPIDHLKQFAALAESKGFKTVGEYIEAAQLEAQKKQQQGIIRSR